LSEIEGVRKGERREKGEGGEGWEKGGMEKSMGRDGKEEGDRQEMEMARRQPGLWSRLCDDNFLIAMVAQFRLLVLCKSQSIAASRRRHEENI